MFEANSLKNSNIYNKNPLFSIYLLNYEQVFVIIGNVEMRRTDMSEKIQVTMFQDFSLQYHDKVLGKDEIKSDKLIILLSYLLYYYDRTISSSELIDFIWSYEEIDNPVGALKNLIYRARSFVKKEFGLDDLIVTGKGSYCINEKYELEIDAHAFEGCQKDLIEDAYNKETYQKIMDLYKGKFLKDMGDDHVTLSRSAYFHSLYITRVSEYATLLERDKEFEKLEQIGRGAISIDSLEESFHMIVIKALYFQGYYQQAIKTYKKTMEHLYRSLGTNPSKEMKDLYEMIKKEKYSEDTDILDIQKGLSISEKYGAYLCEYGAFRDLYNLQARMMERLGVCNHLCVVTINDLSRFDSDKQKNLKYIEKIMQMIQESLVSGLRVGDVVSRFSTKQFVVLLPVCNYEDSSLVMNRILKGIRQSINNKNVSVETSIKEVRTLDLEEV